MLPSLDSSKAKWLQSKTLGELDRPQAQSSNVLCDPGQVTVPLVNLIQKKTLTEISKITFEKIPTHHGSANLTHIIQHYNLSNYLQIQFNANHYQGGLLVWL